MSEIPRAVADLKDQYIGLETANTTFPNTNTTILVVIKLTFIKVN